MNLAERSFITKLCQSCGKDPHRLMDIIIGVQGAYARVSGDAMNLIAAELGLPRVDVESAVSFYQFLSKEQKGHVRIRLCDDIIDRMYGFDRILKAFSEELGIGLNQTTPDGKFTFETTACIGMCDQAPAALMNNVVVTNLNSDSVHDLVESLRKNLNPEQLVKKTGNGNNSHPLVRAMVQNNIRRRGPVIFQDFTPGEALRKGLAMSPMEVIRSVKTARLRGRGGAGFPTGMKWEFTRAAAGDRKFIMCNADEGEPGTFKDRVILTEKPNLIFEGMTLAGYAIGAGEGILYLRGEYTYLLDFLNETLKERRASGLLGKSILGKDGFDFDIRIQLGAGAYICGEETALISSCEGLRGDPKNRPPFPAQKGYLGYPTVVNNVETFCCVSRIIEHGAGWFAEHGTKGSSGTKLLSVSGDCRMPGVYEVPFGISIHELLEMVGADDTYAVQIGGPSGQLIGRADFQRTICFDDLATGGAVMIFDEDRDVLEIVQAFMDFFVHESCGYCTPCRVGNVLLKKKLEEIRAGKGEPSDLEYLKSLGETIKATSRCGLGQTSPNPILTSMAHFPDAYLKLLHEDKQGYQPTFDLDEAVATAARIAGHGRVHHED
ncbi:MAG: NAD(P)H-dependent oxidoreductase subunit E [Acidobacteria bacterium]|nr:NAD(P)H-dependent oxidoreductase subunit E [Acidobacteriota bacterium]